nr:hypothetical protein [Halomonas hibernica]
MPPQVVALDGKTSRLSAKSNKKTTIPDLLATLALEGCIDAMGTQPSIAQAIRDRCAAPATQTPHQVKEEVSKEHGRLETRRCYVFDALGCLLKPTRWPDLRCFAVIESTCESQGKREQERRYYISSLAPNADRPAGPGGAVIPPKNQGAQK